jgi:hypothetical protein
MLCPGWCLSFCVFHSILFHFVFSFSFCVFHSILFHFKQVFVYMFYATTYCTRRWCIYNIISLTSIHIYTIWYIHLFNYMEIIKLHRGIRGNGILRLQIWPTQAKIPSIPLELLVGGPLVGACSASVRSLKKEIIKKLWMKLNTINGNKIKLWILFTYLKLF